MQILVRNKYDDIFYTISIEDLVIQILIHFH